MQERHRRAANIANARVVPPRNAPFEAKLQRRQGFRGERVAAQVEVDVAGDAGVAIEHLDELEAGRLPVVERADSGAAVARRANRKAVGETA